MIRLAEQYLEAHIQSVVEIRHAAETQGILLSWGASEHVQVAALLVPLIRHQIFDDESLRRSFGHRPMQIASIAMKFGFQEVGSLDSSTPTHFAQKLRNLFICAYLDTESVLVCAADRLAGTSHIDEMPPERYPSWSAETLAVDVPLFELLGMWQLHHSIANLGLHLWDAGLYGQYEYYIESYYDRHEPAFEQIASRVISLMARADIAGAQIQMHETTPASLYKRHEKAVKRGRVFDPAEVGILRVDVLVQYERDCYYVMGLLHNMWPPSSSKPIQDEIASPRYNGYRCLTTTVNCDIAGQSVEFRILTHDMAEVNAKGILARRLVKNAWWSDSQLASRVGIRDTRQLDSDICAFTPTGEIVFPLRHNSTVVDFAFKVHSKLGPYARRFFVNGRPRPYNTTIQHRDLVEIEYDMSYPSVQPEWESVAKSSTARSGIKRFLRGRLSPVHRGRELINTVLERECELYKMRFSPEQVEAMLERAAVDEGSRTLDAFYARVANGEIAPDNVVANMIEQDLRVHVIVPEDIRTQYDLTIQFSRSWMQEPDELKFNRASRIYPNVDIVGRLVSPNHRPKLIVYRADSVYAPSKADAIPLSWGSGVSSREAAQIVVTSSTKHGAAWSVLNELNRVAKEVQHSDLLIYSFHADVVDGMTQIQFTIDTASNEFIQQLNSGLRALQHNRLIKSFKMYELFPGQRRLVAGISNRSHHNPFNARYVKDANMFFGREKEITRVVDYISDDVSFLILHGHKRIGKTSIMYYLAEHVLEDACDVIPILFNAQEAAPISTFSFVDSLLDTAQRVVMPYLKRVDDRRELRINEKMLESDPLRVLVSWVKAVEKRLGGTRLYFLVDEFTALEEAHQHGDLESGFFQRMHSIVDSGSVAFMLCIHDNVLRNKNSRLSNMNQRAQLVAVRELEEEDARALIRQPLERLYKIDDEVVDRIIELTNNHPFFIHTLCGELVAYMAATNQKHITLENLKFAVVKVQDSAFHHFSLYRPAMDDLGQDMLKVVAQLCGQNNKGWAAVDTIKKRTLVRNPNVTEIEIAKRIGEAYNAGIIIKKPMTSKPEYRIPVGLLHMWLIEGTHQLPSHMMKEMEKGTLS